METIPIDAVTLVDLQGNATRLRNHLGDLTLLIFLRHLA